MSVDRILPGEEFVVRDSSRDSRAPRTAVTTAALRRAPQRFFAPGGGKSAIDNGLPVGPITYLALDECLSGMAHRK